MEKPDQGGLEPAILQELAARFGLEAAALEPLEGYQSFVYADGARVLKAVSEAFRSVRELRAELAFVAHLAAGGLRVPAPLRSRRGRHVERIRLADGTVLLACCQQQLAGRPPGPADAGPELFAAIGRLLARMHLLAQTYQPPAGLQRRSWFMDAHVRHWRRHVPLEQLQVRRQIAALYRQLRALPRDAASWGTIHGDIHTDNLLLADGELAVIDFGDCLRGPFVMDLGTALYYYRRFLPSGHDADAEAQRELGRSFARHLLRGYQQERPLAPQERAQLPALLRWRQVDLYLYLCYLAHLQPLEPFEQEYLQRFEREIAAGKVPLELGEEVFG